ncbi:MAG: OsmC family protein [Candidatus Thorarchaeota archaeon]
MSEDSQNFDVQLTWTGGKSGDVMVKHKPTIKIGTPPGSEGKDEFHSPEDLFVASATACYMSGFVEFTKKMHISFKSFECDSTGKLESVGRSYEITRIDMKARVAVESESLRGKIERALELAAKYCFVGNSMKCPITHKIEVVVE